MARIADWLFMAVSCRAVLCQASAEIMRLLAQSSPGCAFEKASIDEAYIDITQLAVGTLAEQQGGKARVLSLCPAEQSPGLAVSCRAF